MKKPLQCEKGHIIYGITLNLFSHFHYPQPERAPTNLIVISDFHAHEKGMGLQVHKPSFNQRVQHRFTGLALPPFHIWNDKPDIDMLKVKNNLSWYEEIEREIRKGEDRDHVAMQG
jgi:hypothetical protein